MIQSCESCHTTTGEIGWYCLDENMECELCKQCARELRREVDVEPIDV